MNTTTLSMLAVLAALLPAPPNPGRALISFSSGTVSAGQFQIGCPPDVEWAREIVDEMLEEPRRQIETQTEEITLDDVSSVQDSTICAHLSTATPEFPYPDYIETYYQADSSNGRRYFVVWTRRPPNDPDIVLYAMSFIDVLDENFNHIKGYFW